ncbi:pterin-4-alpha-carbinolamine dehydratase 2-like protein [Aphelenchoides avenae]|nr:pterin-4-alpha-carbinolamine dehydratase 2-like protein [Aphelenchus avenae]KAH7707440.1 pterin-4-alpha-carbinolamine dehydratase 2-like protein [Aphelenchus avenae]
MYALVLVLALCASDVSSFILRFDPKHLSPKHKDAITASVQRKEQTNPFLDAPGQPKRQAGPLLDVPEPPYKQTDPLPASAWQLKANPRGVEKVFQFGNFNEAFGFMSRIAIQAGNVDRRPEWIDAHGKVSFHLRLTRISLTPRSQ